jgi:hypothetical protein
MRRLAQKWSKRTSRRHSRAPNMTMRFMQELVMSTRPLSPNDGLRPQSQSAFRSILPEDIEWKSFPAFPPAARLAVLVGNPTAPGLYVIRVKAPGGTKLMPHKHPEDRIYTVMSGVFYIGLGETSKTTS